MLRLCCTAQFVAALVLAGCGTAQLFADYEVHEDPSVDDAPWPRLVDTPTPPPAGEFSSAVPDPSRGDKVTEDLRTEAAVATVRAQNLAAPILTDAARKALFDRAREARKRRSRDGGDPAGDG